MARILIVEDNPLNLKLATRVLEHAGHEVLQAEDAAKGLELARELKPDLVLMDIMLPGMDGVAALARLRADSTTAGIKVAALTAYAMKGDREKCLDAGASDYLAKPVNTDQLLATLRMWLHR